MERCFLALGSNLGDREAHLRDGLAELDARGVRVIRSASVYSTEPKDVPAQPWFLNTAAEAETRLEPADLIRVCLSIEQEHDRRRSTPKGPRTLDIDIILYGDRVVRTAELTIPHPRYAQRRFVLEPLAEIASGAIDPVDGRTIGALLAAVDDDASVTRCRPPLFPFHSTQRRP